MEVLSSSYLPILSVLNTIEKQSEAVGRDVSDSVGPIQHCDQSTRLPDLVKRSANDQAF